MAKDQIKNCYLVAANKQFYSGDITFLTNKIQLFLLIDLGSKQLVGHLLQNQPMVANQIIDLLSKALATRPTEKEIILHTDNQSIFSHVSLITFCQKNNIVLSKQEPRKCGNQVSERLNGTIKRYLRKRLLNHLDLEAKPWLRKEKLSSIISQFSFNNLVEHLLFVIDQYNNSQHHGDRMFYASPNHMDQALEGAPKTIVKPDLLIAPNNNSEDALEIAQYKGRVIEEFAGNWEQFFISWRKEQTKEHSHLVEMNHRLYEQNIQLNQKIDELVQRDRIREQKEKKAEEARLLQEELKRKRQNFKKQPLRDAITNEDFDLIIKLAKESYEKDWVRARVVVAFTLMYLTGLRVSNLLLFTKRHIKELLECSETTVSLIKRGAPRHLLCIGNKGRSLLRRMDSEIQLLFNLQLNENGPFFASKEHCEVPINRVNFDKQCNKVLVKASIRLEKNIRTHSFRASFITDMLENDVPIETAKDIVGHSHIGTTAQYRRTKIGLKETRRIMGRVQKERLNKWQIPEYRVSQPEPEE